MRSSWLIPTIIVCLVIAALSFTAFPTAEVAEAGAQGKEDDAKKKK